MRGCMHAHVCVQELILSGSEIKQMGVCGSVGVCVCVYACMQELILSGNEIKQMGVRVCTHSGADTEWQ